MGSADFRFGFWFRSLNECDLPVNTLLTITFWQVLSASHTSSRARDGPLGQATPGIDFAPVSLTKLRSLALRGYGMRPMWSRQP
jgi:hypothetical protein